MSTCDFGYRYSNVKVSGLTFPQGLATISCVLHRVTQGLLERRETLGGPAPQDLSAPEDAM